MPRTARFIPSKNAVLVLTANQTVYPIDLPPPPAMDAAEKSR